MTIDFTPKHIIPVVDNGYRAFLVDENRLCVYNKLYTGNGLYVYDVKTKKLICEHKATLKDEEVHIQNPLVLGNNIVASYYHKSDAANPKRVSFVSMINLDNGEKVWQAEKASGDFFIVEGNLVYTFSDKAVYCFDTTKTAKNLKWQKGLNLKAPEVFKACNASDGNSLPSESYLKNKKMIIKSCFMWKGQLVVTTDVNRWAILDAKKGTLLCEIDLTTAPVIKDVMTHPIGEVCVSGDFAVFMNHGIFVRVNLANGTTEAMIPTYKGTRKDAPNGKHQFWSYYDRGGSLYNGRMYTNNATYIDKNNDIQEIYELPIDTKDAVIGRAFNFPLPFKGRDVQQYNSLAWAGYYAESQDKYPGATFYSFEDGNHCIYMPPKGVRVISISYDGKNIVMVQEKDKRFEVSIIPYAEPAPASPAITLDGFAGIAPAAKETVAEKPAIAAVPNPDRFSYLTPKEEPTDKFPGFTVNPQGEAPVNLGIKGSMLLTKNDGNRGLQYLGGNLFSVKGGIPEYVDIIDISTGTVIWTIDQCADWSNLEIADDDAVYLGREKHGDHFLTAHNRQTGETLWHCPLAHNSNQFSSRLVQSDKYLYHHNKLTLFTVDKKTGKKISRIKLVNKDPESCGISMNERAYRAIIPWNDLVLVTRWRVEGKGNNKTTYLVFDCYDPVKKDDNYLGEWLAIEAGRIYGDYMVRGNMLYFVATNGLFYAFDLEKKAIVCEHDFIPNGDTHCNCISTFDVAPDGKSFRLKLRTCADNAGADGEYERPNFFIHYDMEKNKMTYKEVGGTQISHFEEIRGNHLYRFNTKEFEVYALDKLNKPVATLSLFDLPSSYWDDANYFFIGDAIYTLQEGSQKKFKKQSVLHVIKEE